VYHDLDAEHRARMQPPTQTTRRKTIPTVPRHPEVSAVPSAPSGAEPTTAT